MNTENKDQPKLDPQNSMGSPQWWYQRWMMLIYWLATVLAVFAISYLTRQPVPPPPQYPAFPEVPVFPLAADKQKQTGEYGEEVYYFCGRKEDIRGEAIVTKPWPNKTILWRLELQGFVSQTIKPESIKEAYAQAWAYWAKHLDINPVEAKDGERAHVDSKFGDIDGTGKVLAWSELADGTTTVKHQLYDSKERWALAASRGQIDFVAVAAHEIGHVLGLVHDDEGSKALMAPVYDPKTREPQARDWQRAVALGYKQRPKDIPFYPPIPIQIRIEGGEFLEAAKKAGYTIEPPKK